MIKFLTLFTLCENVHLTKDVGMIPYVLHKEYDIDSTIASYDNGEYPNLVTDVPGLKQVFIKRYFSNHTLDSLMFILKNSRKYDVLQCYHFTVGSILTLSLFKFLKIFTVNLTYLKMDADKTITSFRYSGVFGIILKKLVRLIDIVSIETKQLYEFLNLNNTLKRRVSYMPNGFYTEQNCFVDFEHKENIILTVGRIGTDQKSNETLLDAYKKFSIRHPSWKLEVVGPIEDSFMPTVKAFEADPRLKDRVSFTGPINERPLVEDRYNKAKIFALTSKYEGFPLVYLEALKAGCTIVSSAIPPAYDVTDNEKYGRIFPIGDSKALAEVLSRLVEDTLYLEENSAAAQKFGFEKFYWPTICMQLYKKISTKLLK